MPKIIISTIIMLIGSFANAGYGAEKLYEQRVCASVDKSSYDYESTTLTYLINYYNYGGTYTRILLNQHSKNTITRGQAPICQTLKIPQKDKNWTFNRKITVALQNYGECIFTFDPRKIINVTLHHRLGNPLHSWSCTAR